jgi:pimeloyl-ACP methyl ester carboxylesterase
VTAGIAPPARRSPLARAREQSRARYPDKQGFVVRAGARLFYEVYGEGEQTVALLPTWSIAHSRAWRAQIPYLSRHFRVLTFDGLGNGKSDRSQDPRRYDVESFVDDALAVMDETGTEGAVLAAHSRGAQWALTLAANHPQRAAAVVCIAPTYPLSRRSVWRLLLHPRVKSLFYRRQLVYRWWGRMNAHHWRASYGDFAEWFARRCVGEPHSTKLIEDAVAWAHETEPETLIATIGGRVMYERRELLDVARRVKCPVLVIHGDRDAVSPYADGKALAKATGGRLETVRGGSHAPHGRRPVQVNLAIRQLADGTLPRKS